MKKAIILLILMRSIFAIAQNEPNQTTFTYPADGNSNYLINADNADFRQNEFKTGFIWSGDARMNSVFGVNAFLSNWRIGVSPWPFWSADHFNDNTDIILAINGLSRGPGTWYPFQTISVQLEPNLLIDYEGVFKTRSNDPTKPVFGFKEINSQITINDSQTELILDKNGGYNNQLVLWNPWPDNVYDSYDHKVGLNSIDPFELDNVDLDNNGTLEQDVQISDNLAWNGAEMFVSIRLHRLTAETSGDVLRITLPYTSPGYQGDIKFSAVPTTTTPYTSNILTPINNENRGLSWNLYTIPLGTPKPTSITITAAMLPTNGDYITVSGYFECKDPTPNNHNVISTLGIEVEYLGNCNVGIDWIRIETRDARRLYRGSYDYWIRDRMQTAINQFTTEAFRNAGKRFNRVYLCDEIRMQHWGVTRYFNKFVGNIGISQTGSEYSKFFTYYTESPQVWTEEGAVLRQASCPYIRRGNELNVETMNLKNGFEIPFEALVSGTRPDTLNSSWEFFPYGENPSYSNLRNCTLSEYYNNDENNYGYLNQGIAQQIMFERLLYEQFYHYESDFNLYGPGYFWYQNFTPIFHLFDVTGGHRIGYESKRPFTGEEFRLYFWNALIFGAKGLIIDRENTEPFCYNCGPDNNTHNFGVAGLSWGAQYYFDRPDSPPEEKVSWTTQDIMNNFRSNLLGGDFLNVRPNLLYPQYPNSYHTNYEPALTYNYPQSNITEFLNLNAIESTNGISRDRIYLGRATMRSEYKKLTDLINETTGTEDDLMNLRLEAALMHGYKIWYHQNPRFGEFTKNEIYGENDVSDKSDWIISKFVNTNSIKTRKVFQPITHSNWYDPTTYEDVSTFESEDLSLCGVYNSAPRNEYFYNLTLLSHKDDPDMENIFYIGLVNRCTDPLIYYYDENIPDTDTSISRHYMKFLSTAELEDLCNYGGVDPDHPISNFLSRQHWIDLYWQRLGSRKMQIPLKVPPEFTGSYPLLHVSEVGSGNTFLNIRIDEIIDPLNDKLEITLLPGQGMLLKIEILRTVCRPGNLAFSNQSKITGSPIILNNVVYYDSLYYHLVYHRLVNDTNRVFYRRSKIVTDTAPLLNYSNIVWEEPEMCLSDSVWVDCAEESHYHPDCAYPAIVVRPDDTGKNVAYVVFACDYNQGLAIVENKLDADAAYPIPRDRPKIISNVSGRNKADWGTPMINASPAGNFYTWSDSTLGVAIAWKDTAAACLQATNYFRFDASNQRACGHPSLNSYSRQGENECALVWSEVNGTSPYPPYQSTHRLVYARPKYDGSNIYLDQFRPMNTVPGIAFNPAMTMAAIGNPVNADNKFPVVYRGLEEQPFQDKDRIAWQDMNDEQVNCSAIPPYSALTTSINYLMVDTETRQGNDSSFFYPIKYLHAESISPNIANGKFWGSLNNLSDSAMIMEFSTYDACDPYDTTVARSIWSVPHGFISFLSSNSYTLGQIQAMTHATQLSGNGFMPHLAARPTTDGESGWWKNRRVFMEADNTIGDTLLASAETFYKGGAKKIAVPFVGFVNNENTSLISPFMLDGEPIGFDIAENLKLGCDTCLSSKLPETIRTKWFKVGSRAALDLFAKGIDLDNVEMYVERRSNRQTSRINIVSMADTIMAPVNFSLLNGGNNEYRILFKRRNNLNYYTEHLYFMPDPFAGMMLKRGEEGTIMVDLGMTSNDNTDNNLRIYPNPAENVLYVTACNSMGTKTRLKVRIYTSLSELVDEYEVNSCETATIPTAGLPPGVYFVRAGIGKDTHQIVRSFAIAR